MAKLKDNLIPHGVCLLLLVCYPSSASALGRLFFTPEQRLNLDQARKQPPKKEATEPTAVETFTLNGIVKRDDGSVTLWINNRPITQRGGASSENPNEARVQLPGTHRDVKLKVGQTIRSDSDKIEDPHPTYVPDKPKGGGR